MLCLRGILPSGSALLVRRRAIASVAALAVLASSGWATPGAALAQGPSSPAASGPASASIHSHPTRHACTLPGRGRAACHAIVRTDVAPLSTGVTASGRNLAGFGYHPADLQSAYALTAAAAAGGSGVTVAIIDAYDDPTAEADMAAYRAAFGLPPCTSTGSNPCFRKVNQRGQSTPLPEAEAGWATEISLDLDMVSAICPNCSILLVEADSAYLRDLGVAVNQAVASGAKYISNSYGWPEDDWAPVLDAVYFKHPGVVITASTGDSGYEGYLADSGLSGNQYPSVSPWVVAVGGTSLHKADSARGWSETAWSDAGAGCSLYEPRPSWQTEAVTSCSRRMVADVSAVADPETGVAVVFQGTWYQVGGTSAAAPIVAAAYALAGTPAATSWPVSYPYAHGGLNDAVGGSNSGGTCNPDPDLWCSGVAGYDGPTGLGSPNGTIGLGAPGLPGAPTGIGALAGSGSAQVTWSAPASDGGSPITSYRAIALPGGKSCVWSSGPLSCTISGLANGTSYRFTVRATNAVGSGPQLSTPSQPTSVAGSRGNGTAAVAWSPPDSDGGLPVTGYTAIASPGGASCSWTSGPLGCTVTGLTNGTPYTFSVRASNLAGSGLASPASAAVTPAGVPGAPRSVAATGGNASAAVTWQAPASNGGAPVTGYTVTASPGGATCGWSTGPLTCSVTGLATGTPYTFRVTATNAIGTGPASDPSAPLLLEPVPDPPTDVVAVPAAPTPGAVAVSWTAPSSAGISKYTAYASLPDTGTVVGSCTSAAPPEPVATHCAITGLGNGVTVVVRVSAANAGGESARSAPSGPVTTPRLGTATVASLAYWTVAPSFGVSWSANPGTNPVASYEVRYRRSAWNGSFGSPVAWLSTSDASAVFSPARGSTYCFSARAIDQAGFPGPWAAERCTTAPLDERALARSGGWSSGTGAAYYAGTSSTTAAYGAVAVRTSVRAKQIVLVATSCRACGTVRVYLGSTLLRTISLSSAATANQRVFAVATFAAIRSGTVTVKVSSSGRKVLIDGLGISRM